jgi:hypothetical protein
MGIFSFLKTAKNALKDEALRRSPQADPRLAKTPLREGFGCGLIHSEQIMAWCDALPTGLDADWIHTGLADYWDIFDRNTAVGKLGKLAAGANAYVYRLAAQELFGAKSLPTLPPLPMPDGLPEEVRESAQSWRDLLETLGAKPSDVCVPGGATSEEAETLTLAATWAVTNKTDALRELTKNLREIGDKTHGTYKPAHFLVGVEAWDIGRMVSVARMCGDEGLLDWDEVATIVAWVGQATKGCYRTWDEVAVAFLIGRACLYNSGITFNGLTQLSDELLTNPASPWARPLR